MSNETTASNAKRLAAVDIGSNSIRLLVAEVAPDGGYRILDDEKRTTRLAHGIAQTGRLDHYAVDQSLETLGRMKAIAHGYNVEYLEVIATSAVREASNRDSFLQLVKERVGLDIRVISSNEEAELSFSSVARHFDLRTMDTAVVDLGGGSAELILAAQGVIDVIYPLPLGAVRLTEAFIASDPLDDSEFRKLKKHIRKTFESVVGEPSFLPHVMIGVGGTFTALANISMRWRRQSHRRVGGYELNRSEVRHILDHMIDLSLNARRNVPGLNADRADIITAGLLVIERLMKYLRINRLLIHDQGVRDGLLLHMIESVFHIKPTPGDDPDALGGVRAFANACGFEQRHSEHIVRLVRNMFEQLRGPLGLIDSDLFLLEAAAYLHEVGCVINHARHHQHSYHLIMHGNFRGLSPQQRELVANIARYHRRAAPKAKHENFARLSLEERDTVRRLSALLRLADGLDRSHTQQIQRVDCEVIDGKILMCVTADVYPEVDIWGAKEKGKLFERTFGLGLEFAWRPPSEVNGLRTRSATEPAVHPPAQ